MAVKFLPPIANASQFPAPTVSATPDFHLTDVKVFKNSPYELSKAIFTRNGRGAIGIAGKALKKAGNNVILIPSYHCPALVEPFIWLDYEIRFYPVCSDLSVDINVLKEALNAGDITHCVVVRYFGFNQNCDEVITFLQGENVDIIEDCAHAMFRFLHHFDPHSDLGSQVSASICSINKILPTVDGGALYMADPVETQLQQTGWIDEFKAFAYLMGIPQFIDRLRSAKKPQPVALVEQEDSSQLNRTINDGLRYFQPVDVNSASYRHTYYILNRSDISKIRQQRRNNFAYLLANINNPDVGKPLYSHLEELDVPYVFPFLLNDDKHFFSLRKLGIQILRWEEVAISEFPVSASYRSRLIQIPCHHQLTQNQLDFVIHAINELHP